MKNMKNLKKLRKILALALAGMLCLALAACSSESGDNSAGGTAYERTDVNIAVLAGPTGIGAVGLMASNDAGETVNNYNFTVTGANDEVVAGLTSGEYDMAALATNVAANLYNKTNGSVQICALNTYGVLYILENGDTIQSIADLKGKTVYATGQGANPEYVLKYLLEQNGLTWSVDGTPADADVQIEFMASDAVTADMASGEYDVCMLPVPAVTSVMMQNSDVRSALNLTDEWNKVAQNNNSDGVLTMGCIVVRSEFAEENPEAVAAFLQEYAASIETVQSDVEYAAELCEEYGVVAKAAVAAKAIPDCNLCCITGSDISSAIESYYAVLFEANPDSIGGAMPGEDFYFNPEK
jgi:NitT/TauT family transport system substrate-binding protein